MALKKTFLLTVFWIALALHISAQFQVNGSASSLGNDCFQLTPAQNNQGGAVWATQPINLNQSFDFYIQMQFGCSDGGADGMAFVFQQMGSGALGTTGGSMGIGGISPSVVIEFDTYENSTSGDLVADHIGILSNGSNDHTSANSLAGPVTILASGGDAEDCNYHEVHVSWNAVTHNLQVLVDCNLRLSYTGNIVSNIFGNNPDVFFGFTASTGALDNDHRVCVQFVPGYSRLQDESMCQGDNLMVDVTPGISYNWTPTAGVSNPVSGTPVLTPNSTTTYQVTITDLCGFNWQDSVTVSVATVDAGPNQMIGFGQNTVINSSYNGPPSVGNCLVYTENTVPFAPYALNAPSSFNLAVGATDFSGAIPLGFNFDFYCNSYSQAYFATGGYLTFTNGASNTTPTSIPTLAFPNNLIAYCWSSLDSMSISYESQGTAPNRRFVVNIAASHWFSNLVNPPNGDPVNVQLVLFETGEIEIHTSQIAASWFSNMAQGIEGPTGSNGVAIAGRNNAMGWTSSNEGLRFEPQPANVVYTWTPNTHINDPTLEDPTVSPTVDTWYYVTRDDGNCILTDSVYISITPLDIDANELPGEEKNTLSLDILPNPSEGLIRIRGWQEASLGAQWELFNLKGQQLKSLQTELEAGVVNWQIDLKDLPKGLYFYYLQVGEEFRRGKLLLK